MEFERLWREYADATRTYLKIVIAQYGAAIDQDPEALSGLNSLHREAGEKRRNALKALQDHEAV